MPFQLRNRLNQAVPVHLKIGGKIVEVMIPPKKTYPKDADERVDNRECYEDHEFTSMAQTLVSKRYLSKHDIKVKPETKPIPKVESRKVNEEMSVDSVVVDEEASKKVTEKVDADLGVDIDDVEAPKKKKATPKKKTAAKTGKKKKKK